MATRTKYVDWGGLTPIVDGIRVGSTKPGGLGTELTGTEILYLDGLTAGTATASKALVLDSSKSIATITSLTATTFAGTPNFSGAVPMARTLGVTGVSTFTVSPVFSAAITSATITTLGTTTLTPTTIAGNANFTGTPTLAAGITNTTGVVTLGAGSTVNVDSATTTASGTGGTSTATLSKMAGVITSDAITTPGLAAHTVTVTNTTVAAGDLVFVCVANGTNNQASPVISTVVAGASSIVFTMRNTHATEAVNGTVVWSFIVFKA